MCCLGRCWCSGKHRVVSIAFCEPWWLRCMVHRTPFSRATPDISEGNRRAFPVNTRTGNICPAHWIKGFFLMCCLTPYAEELQCSVFLMTSPIFFLSCLFGTLFRSWSCEDGPDLVSRICPSSCTASCHESSETLFFFFNLLFYLRAKAHLFSWSHNLILAVWQPSLKWRLGCESVQGKEVLPHRWWWQASPEQSPFPCGLRLWSEELQTSTFQAELRQNVSSVCTSMSNTPWPPVFRSSSLQLTKCQLSNDLWSRGHHLLPEKSQLCFGSSLGLMFVALFSRAHWLHVFQF